MHPLELFLHYKDIIFEIFSYLNIQEIFRFSKSSKFTNEIIPKIRDDWFKSYFERYYKFMNFLEGSFYQKVHYMESDEIICTRFGCILTKNGSLIIKEPIPLDSGSSSESLVKYYQIPLVKIKKNYLINNTILENDIDTDDEYSESPPKSPQPRILYFMQESQSKNSTSIHSTEIKNFGDWNNYDLKYVRNVQQATYLNNPNSELNYQSYNHIFSRSEIFDRFLFVRNRFEVIFIGCQSYTVEIISCQNAQSINLFILPTKEFILKNEGIYYFDEGGICFHSYYNDQNQQKTYVKSLGYNEVFAIDSFEGRLEKEKGANCSYSLKNVSEIYFDDFNESSILKFDRNEEYVNEWESIHSFSRLHGHAYLNFCETITKKYDDSLLDFKMRLNLYPLQYENRENIAHIHASHQVDSHFPFETWLTRLPNLSHILSHENKKNMKKYKIQSTKKTKKDKKINPTQAPFVLARMQYN
jgi:hypothetical protein